MTEYGLQMYSMRDVTKEDLEKTLGKSPIIFEKPSNVKFITFCAEKLRLAR